MPIPPAIVCATALVDTLIGAGVTRYVLSPGSRSAPLALALAEREQQGLISLQVRIDERGAGFFALGLAAADHEPVAVVCTSGTAVANLYPAVVEANHSGLPLIMLTADRPPELRSVGAPQTINQVGIFADNVRWAQDLPTPGTDVTQERNTWQTAALAAVEASHDGPVHLNLPFRPPLVGAVPKPAIQAAAPASPRPDPASVPLPADGVERGVIVVGDLALSPAANEQLWQDLTTISRTRRWPILAEPTANPITDTNLIQHAPLVLRSEGFCAAHAPDFLLSVGRFGLSRPVMALARAAQLHWSVNIGGRPGPLDPALSATRQLDALPTAGDPSPDTAGEDQNQTTPSGVAGAWLAQWLAADAQATDLVRSWFSSPEADSGAAATLAAWPPAASGETVFVAASWPVRYVDSFVTASSGVRVVANRGANGIDGLVSTAFGLAVGLGSARQRASEVNAGQERPPEAGSMLAIVGDIAFLHDVGALVQVPAHLNLTILVLDNNGGGIFSQLEQGEPAYARDFDRVFGTPTHQDLRRVSAGFGVPTVTVTNVSDLRAALERARATAGCHVVVMKTGSRASEANLLSGITQALQAALG